MATLEYVFTADGRTWTLDYYSLTFGEWMAAERATGMPWVAIANQLDQRTATGLLVFYWLTRRREQANLSFHDAAIQKLRPTDFDFTVNTVEDDASPPVDNGHKPPGSASSPTNPSVTSTTST